MRQVKQENLLAAALAMAILPRYKGSTRAGRVAKFAVELCSLGRAYTRACENVCNFPDPTGRYDRASVKALETVARILREGPFKARLVGTDEGGLLLRVSVADETIVLC